MAKKRTPTRKSSTARKRVTKAARPRRKKATARAMPTRGVNFNPVKRELRAHIAKLEKQLGGAEGRAAAPDQRAYETLDQLKALNAQLTNICQPTMVIGNS